MRPPRGPSARPLSRAQSALRPGPPPWRWPARPQRWRAGPAKVCGQIAAARPCPAPARGPSPPLVLAGGWRRGPRPVVGLRPVSLLAARKPGGDTPPPGALCRGGGGPVAGCGRLGVGLAAWPASVPRLRLTRPPPGGAPPSPGGGVGAAPCLGPARGSLWAGSGRRKPRFSPSPGGRKGRRDYTRRPRKRLPRATKERCPPAGCGPPPPHEGG